MTVFHIHPAGSDPRAQNFFQIGCHGSGSFPRSGHKNPFEAGKGIDPLTDAENIFSQGDLRRNNTAGICGPNPLAKNLFRIPSE
jgi:hypothetical protein